MQTLTLKLEVNGVSHETSINYGTIERVNHGDREPGGFQPTRKILTIDNAKVVADCNLALAVLLADAGFGIPPVPAARAVPTHEPKRSKRSE